MSSPKSVTSTWNRGLIFPIQVGALWWRRWVCLECNSRFKTDQEIFYHFIKKHVEIE